MSYPVEVPASALASLIHLIDEFEEELKEGPPTLGEFLDVLDYSVPDYGSMSGMFADPRFAATLAGGRRYRRPEGSRADGLNDAVYVEANEFLAALADAAYTASGKRVGLTVLAAVVAAAVQASDVRFADAAGGDIAGVTARGRRILARAEPGDVIAIPTDTGGGYHLVVGLNRDHTFGLSVGVVQGRVVDPRLDHLPAEPAGIPYGQYVQEDLISNKTWQIVGRRDDLRALWPAVTEVYYNTYNPKPGSFASAGQPRATRHGSSLTRTKPAQSASSTARTSNAGTRQTL